MSSVVHPECRHGLRLDEASHRGAAVVERIAVRGDQRVDLHEILGRAGAPGELVRVVREDALELDDAWERCAQAEHRVWLAACGGAPIEALIEAAGAAVLVACERYGDVGERIASAVELAVAGAMDELALATDRCEALASDHRGTYRDARHPGLAGTARAATLVARAAQGLVEGEARRDAVRLDRARRTAAMFGGGTHISLPPDPGPPRLHPALAGQDPAQGAFLFSVAACAEAVAECSAASRAEGIDLDGELDGVVRSVIEHGVLPP